MPHAMHRTPGDATEPDPKPGYAPTYNASLAKASSASAIGGIHVRKRGFDPVRLAAAGLALLAVVAVIGGSLALRRAPVVPPATGAEAGTQPAAAVYVGQTGEAERAAALRHASKRATTPAAPAPARAAAAKPAIDGKAVYDGLCFACHASGVGNAPTLDRAHWDKRLAQGKDALYRHAIDGYVGPDGGMMPPKGGNPSLSDAEVRASVDWMLGNLK